LPLLLSVRRWSGCICRMHRMFSESLLRSQYPYVTSWCSKSFRSNTMKPSWRQLDARPKSSSIMPVKKYNGKFICMVEGGVGTKFDGGYGKVGGRTF
jgi:[NiFe] hydrogenase small subunit